MKTQTKFIGFSALLVTLSSCGNPHTITDNITLYPANAAAQSWGILRFYSQYQSNSLPERLYVDLPNGTQANGQITYLEESGVSEADIFWDNASIGIGQYSRHGSVGFIFSPRAYAYRSDKQNVNINLFGEQISMNCQGEFNRMQKAGTLTCLLTNGMQYRGTLRRVITQ